MQQAEKGHALASVSASALMGGKLGENLKVKGRYVFECHGANGALKWTDTIENTVVTVGKNLILDQSLAGSAYTAAEYLGLISSSSYSAISAADTMASHAGWLEAGSANAPTYSGNRGTAAWSAASAGAKALSSSLTFTMTGIGTIKGGFMVGGSGAVNTVGSTAGVLISAGLFTGGDRSVIIGDTVSVSYSMSI
jgi:Tfp pilus assembly protein PilV